ncbi:hypothetical protein X801_00340 [Opisthorchis viverrini]|uniref:Uncharacterized protein n=2 Tax=Opisthorchis viverrini TaxID=6198 RepID=A0A074ZMS9_OPIVI|nr:hypothetical protein T265_04538 [Opisthorchis viverrini]KER28663.1 hypothetical protein T265_04538 [Opisthorchis viverrini]OON23743.1 hypothetical protein X801_00340 [Opisthorchis viverrini]
MADPAPVLRLHKIHSSMSFGHTDYVPEEETRNLCANFPEPDILQPFKEIATRGDFHEDSFDNAETVACARDKADHYCKDLSSHSLSHPDYRKLSWISEQGDSTESVAESRRAKTIKVVSPSSQYTRGIRTSVPSEVASWQLEARYRQGNTIPFCLNPNAAYLIHHSSITGQRKRVEQELGTCVVYLNDRNHLRALEKRLQVRLERMSDTAHKNRALAEYIKLKSDSRDEIERILSPFKKENESPDPCEGILSQELQIREYPSDFHSDGSQADAPKKTEEQPEQEQVTEGETVTASEEEQQAKPVTSPTVSVPRTEPLFLKLDSTEALLSSTCSMTTLYDNAEKSVKSKHMLDKRGLKYTNLSWER